MDNVNVSLLLSCIRLHSVTTDNNIMKSSYFSNILRITCKVYPLRTPTPPCPIRHSDSLKPTKQLLILHPLPRWALYPWWRGSAISQLTLDEARWHHIRWPLGQVTSVESWHFDAKMRWYVRPTCLTRDHCNDRFYCFLRMQVWELE